MYHPNHPDGDYQVANKVAVFDPPRAIGWLPGYRADDGQLAFGGWLWRYDLATSATSVVVKVDQSLDEKAGYDVDAASKGNLGAWESSGVVDASAVFGPGFTTEMLLCAWNEP